MAVSPQKTADSLTADYGSYVHPNKNKDSPFSALLVGVPGAGKSFVIKKLAETHPEHNAVILNIGDLMYELALSKYSGVITNRDDMRNKLTQTQQETLRDEAIKNVAQKTQQKGATYFIDTHLTVENPAGYLGGVPPAFFNTLKPDFILLVEDTPDAISRRRTKDNNAGKRVRDPNQNKIDHHQRLNRLVAEKITSNANIPLLITGYSPDGDEGAKKDAQTIHKFLKENATKMRQTTN
ncbi:Adenylate kinase [uncultured archaeon]|nr:Adenylate kinase [uncultured archaeon]